MNTIRIVALTVGSFVGAGFISGAELVRFFPSNHFLPALFISFFLLFLFTYACFCFGKKYGAECEKKLGGAVYRPITFFLRVASLTSCSAMLAALDGAIACALPLPSIAGLVLACILVGRGMRAVSVCNLLLVPIILGIIFSTAGEWECAYPFVQTDGRAFLSGSVYAGLNAFLTLPVLTAAGKECKRPFLTAFCSVAIVFACAVVILGRVYKEGASAIGAEMPYLYAMRSHSLFQIASVFAILTSLISSVYPLLHAFSSLSKGKRIAARGGLLLAAFLLSRVGLGRIVFYLYPVFGVCGYALLAVWIFNDRLFQKHDEKIHQRREKAKNARRAHHEVEFEHLPTVHDEVSKPRL